MFWFFLQPARFLAQALTDQSSARQIAFGFALGMMIGLVPKGNLIAVTLMTLLCALRMNLAAGTVAALLFSWAAMWTDPLAHQIGHWLLTAEALVPFWTTLYDQPVLPWTDFNNTVVLGSLAAGALFFLPTYWLTKPLFAWLTPKLSARLQRFKVARLLWGTEWAGTVAGALRAP